MVPQVRPQQLLREMVNKVLAIADSVTCQYSLVVPVVDLLTVQHPVQVFANRMVVMAILDQVAVDLVVHSPVRHRPLLVQLKVAVGL